MMYIEDKMKMSVLQKENQEYFMMGEILNKYKNLKRFK